METKEYDDFLPFQIFCDCQRTHNEWCKGSGREPWRRIDFEQIQRQCSKSRHKHCSQFLLCNGPMKMDWLVHKDIRTIRTRNLWNMYQVKSIHLLRYNLILATVDSQRHLIRVRLDNLGLAFHVSQVKLCIKWKFLVRLLCYLPTTFTTIVWNLISLSICLSSRRLLISLIKLHAIKLDAISNKVMATTKKYSNQRGLSNSLSLILSIKFRVLLSNIMICVSLLNTKRLQTRNM